MQLRITAHDLEVTDALKDYIEKKSAKLKEKTPIINMHVHLKFDKKDDQKVTVTLHIKGHDFEASAHNKDMYEAINEALKKASILLTKNKEQTKEH